MKKKSIIILSLIFLFLAIQGIGIISITIPYESKLASFRNPINTTEAKNYTYNGELAVVLCLDNSGSMSGEMDDLKNAAHLILDYLSSETYVALVIYESSAIVEVNLDQKGNGTQEKDMEAAIDAMDDGGATNAEEGAQASLDELLGSQFQDSFVILMCDGDIGYIDDWKQPNSPAVGMKNESICLHTVGFGVSDTEKDKLIQLSNITNCGKYYDASNATALAMSFAKLGNELEGWEDQGTIYDTIDSGENITVTTYDCTSSQRKLRITLAWGDNTWILNLTVINAITGEVIVPLEEMNNTGEPYIWKVYDCSGSMNITVQADTGTGTTDYGLNLATDENGGNGTGAQIPSFPLVFFVSIMTISLIAIIIYYLRREKYSI
ncbi:MAG: VWA domain-containing protein [Promethearchaeota archaeon]|nr:MAG: VWA domain-containing protein [Candidatus Lokiarchaeota archaeon]